MRALVQRVSSAAVTIAGQVEGAIQQGLVVLVGIEEADTPTDMDWLAKKIVQLRIFNDHAGVPNLSVLQTGGDLLVVSQFTLMASIKKGNRPSYIRAAAPSVAIPLYSDFIQLLQVALGKPVQTGVFGADMQVSLVNDGPLTIWLDSKNPD